MVLLVICRFFATLHFQNIFQIICIHEENNSFNVIQRRMNGGETFTRGWRDYQYGFGHTQGDYWAGLNQIYYLTSTGKTIP